MSGGLLSGGLKSAHRVGHILDTTDGKDNSSKFKISKKFWY